jgi:hypothetical protein
MREYKLFQPSRTLNDLNVKSSVYPPSSNLTEVNNP